LGIPEKQRPTPQEILEKEKDRQFSLKIRNAFQEAQEIDELQGFLKRRPHLQISLVRPNNFDEYIGQKDVKNMVMSLLQASKIKKTAFPHTLFWAEAGLGKTTLSYLIAKELCANLVITSGAQLETRDELLNIFKQFKDGLPNILFIDEIHAIRRRIAEMLYSAMEDFRFDYTTKTNKVLSLNLPAFTLLGATTDLARLLIPIRQRFQNRFQLLPYDSYELCLIIFNFLNRLGYANVKPEIIQEISLRCRNTARLAINFTKNILDYHLAQKKIITVEMVKEYFEKEGVDKSGLTAYDRKYLTLLLHSQNFKAGINTLTKSLGIDRITTEREIEPYLLRQGLIAISTGGRELTEKGFDYIC
jgi:Holliday junction DNA helicase RuvB